MGWRGGGASLPVKGNGGHFQQFYQYIDNALKVLYCTVVFPLFIIILIGEIWRERDDFFLAPSTSWKRCSSHRALLHCAVRYTLKIIICTAKALVMYYTVHSVMHCTMYFVKCATFAMWCNAICYALFLHLTLHCTYLHFHCSWQLSAVRTLEAGPSKVS